MARGKYELHGEAGKYNKTTEYVIYCNMLTRCYNPKATFYEYYGGRGIKVCDRWRESFSVFLADVGRRPDLKHTLDRIDNDGNYEPSNVRWATRGEQLRNRRDNRAITANGRTMCLQDWSNLTGLNPCTIHKRLAMGWTPENAVSPKKYTGRAIGSPGFASKSDRSKMELTSEIEYAKRDWERLECDTQKDPAAPGEVILD